MFLFRQGVFFYAIGYRNHEVLNTEMEISRVNFGRASIGKDCLEPYAEFANACRIVTFGACANTSDRLYIL